MIKHVRRRHLAAQVNEMIGPQPVFRPGLDAIASAIARISPTRKPSSSSEPSRRQSNTVVMPEDAICASCDWIAEIAFQRTPGLGE
jgi:hypothetical protein